MSAVTRSIQTEVLVIGGGATGVGTAWDAALRGFDVREYQVVLRGRRASAARR